MSKFIDRLKQVSQSAPQPMGFQASKAISSRPKIQLVANLRNASSEAVVGQSTPADAIIVPESQSNAVKAIWGTWLTWGSAEEVSQDVEAGADFMVFHANTTVAPPVKKVGRILQVESSITDALLRTLNELPLDAVLLDDKGSGQALTWQRLMSIQRCTSFLSKPLLVSMPLTATADELQLIWETGVSGVIVDVTNEEETAALKNLRQLIDGLSFPSRKKREKLTPVLPYITEKAEEKEPDEDEDE